jgi:hypothetical protein
VAVPTTFKREVFIKNPVRVMASIWAISLTIWVPITIIFNNVNFSSTLDYHPIYFQNIFNIFFWFVPLILILVFSLRIIWILNKRDLKKISLRNKAGIRMTIMTVYVNGSLIHNTPQTNLTVASPSTKKKSVVVKKKLFKRFTPQIRFILIILIYWIQWFIPCVAVLLNGLCNCIPPNIAIPIYWLT